MLVFKNSRMFDILSGIRITFVSHLEFMNSVLSFLMGKKIFIFKDLTHFCEF